MARKDRKDRGLYTRTLKDGKVVWGVRLSWHGSMLRFSPFPSKTKAREFYDKAKTEQCEGRFFPERYHAKRPLVDTFLNRYRPTIAQKKSAREEIAFDAWWTRWYANRSLSAMTAEDLEQARRALLAGQWAIKNRPRTPARVNRYTQWLHQVLSHAVNRAHVPFGVNPVERIKKYPERRPSRCILNPAQEVQLIARLEEETPGVTNWIDVAILCGLRQSEQFTRLKSEVNTELWIFVIPQSKHQDEPKIAHIPPSARPAVQRMLLSPGPWLIPHPKDSSLPFPISRWYKTKFRRAIRAVGLPARFNWHSLRHTFASRMLMAGASTKTVADAGGWSSARMVEDVYGHLTNQFVVDAMEQAATVRVTASPLHGESAKES